MNSRALVYWLSAGLGTALQLAMSPLAHGQTNSWIDGSGKWETATNWSLGTAPSSSDLADLITNAGVNTITIDATTTNTPASMTVSNLTLGGPAGMTNTLALSNVGSSTIFHVFDQFAIGTNAVLTITNAVLQIGPFPFSTTFNSDGVIILDNALLVATNGVVTFGTSFSRATNTFTMNGSAALFTSVIMANGGVSRSIWTANDSTNIFKGQLTVGSSGDGTLTINGGQFVLTNGSSNGNVALSGNNAAAHGTLVISSAYMGARSFNIGAPSGVGSMTLNAGAQVSVASNVTLGGSVSGTGFVWIAGSTLIVTNAAHNGIIDVRAGTFILSNGTVVADALVVTNSNANFSNLGGLFTITQPAKVDSGTLTTLNNATNQFGSTLTVAPSANSTATVSVAGGQLVTTNGVIGIGNDGTATNGFGVGTMTVSNGTVLGSQVLLGSSVGGQGQLTVQTNGLVSLVGTGAVLVANDVTIDGGDVEIGNGQIFCGKLHPGAMTMSNGTANAQITYVGYDSQGTLTMLAGQMTVSSLLDIGFTAGSTGSVWMSGGQLNATALPTIIGNSGVGQWNLSGGTLQASTLVVGSSGGPGGTLTVGGGLLIVSAGLNIGSALQSTGTVWVSGGQLLASSSTLVIGNSSGIGQLTISNGSVQASAVVLTNGANSQLALIGGTLSSGGTVVTNTQRFVVGNGSGPAAFSMLGGMHWFGNGLEVATNSTLSGCGTISGTITVDSGGRTLANCGGTLTFAGSVTNNGIIRASGGSVLNFGGPVVNNGVIDVLNGGVNFSSPPTGSGAILTTSCVPTITAIQKVGADIHVSFTSGTNAPYAVSYETDLVTGGWTTLTNVTATDSIMTVTDSGAALLPERFYRVNLVVPP